MRRAATGVEDTLGQTSMMPWSSTMMKFSSSPIRSSTRGAPIYFSNFTNISLTRPWCVGLTRAPIQEQTDGGKAMEPARASIANIVRVVSKAQARWPPRDTGRGAGSYRGTPYRGEPFSRGGSGFGWRATYRVIDRAFYNKNMFFFNYFYLLFPNSIYFFLKVVYFDAFRYQASSVTRSREIWFIKFYVQLSIV